MGVEIKLTDREFPVSPVFIDFLHRHIREQAFEGSWHDQLSEVLVPAQAEERQKAAVAVADEVLQHPAGQKAIYRSYELLTALLIGQPEKLRSFHGATASSTSRSTPMQVRRSRSRSSTAAFSRIRIWGS